MVQYVITPWRNTEELLYTRSQFYSHQQPSNTSNSSGNQGKRSIWSKDEEELESEPKKEDECLQEWQSKKEAVARVYIWMQRGNCPHMVESTAILTSAILNDHRGGNENYCVRAVYAAAFSRFVTGLLDCHQDKRHKLSMYAIAKNIGLPATFVELRHQASHEELPLLTRLRSAAQKALRWIWNYYWINLTCALTTTASNPSLNIPPKCDSSADLEAWLRKVLLSPSVKDHNSSSGKKGQSINDKDHFYSDDAIVGEARRKSPKSSDDLLLTILIKIQNSTLDDVDTLLRISRIQAMLLGADSSVKRLEPPSVNSFHELQVELDTMKCNLSSSKIVKDENKNQEDEVRESIKIHEETTTTKGWTMWEGPWIPKPIGVV